MAPNILSGGNHVLVGGSVQGGRIHGRFPSLRVDGPNSISATGQMLPTTPWEGLWQSRAEWLGVQPDNLDSVLPNYRSFDSLVGSPHLPTAADVFSSLP